MTWHVDRSTQTSKPMASLRNAFTVFATTHRRGLSYLVRPTPPSIFPGMRKPPLLTPALLRLADMFDPLRSGPRFQTGEPPGAGSDEVL